MLPMFHGATRAFNAAAKLTLFFAVLIFANFAIYSQAGTSSISGTISDAQGNIVAGVTVTLTSQQNSQRTTVTNDNGVYTFSSVQPGTYTLQAEAKGFKRSSLSSFQALVDKTTTIDV